MAPIAAPSESQLEGLRGRDSRCDTFERQWKNGQRPRIEDLLAGVPSNQQASLFEVLLALELALLKQQGEAPSREAYLHRFPQHQEAVDKVFQVLLGRFRLIKKLGEGGMAVVWRAVDLESGQEVALKQMKSTLTGTAKARFLREFSAIVSVDHPHCLKVFEYGETPQGPFFTMEVFPGRPLTSLLGRPIPVLLDALRQAAQAIDFMHSRKLIHRDIKPTNLLVRRCEKSPSTPFGVEVKLSDFGLARFHGSVSSLSVEAGFLGTLAYCAPEQIESEGELDHRADLYALGVVAYELLAGRHPFASARRAGASTLIQAQLSESPAPLSFAGGGAATLAQAVLRYLAKDPGERPDSARLLRDALAEQLALPAAVLANLAPSGAEAGGTSAEEFVCRGRELDALQDLLERGLDPAGVAKTAWTQAPIPSAALVAGEAGIGKSSVLREFRRESRQLGCPVYDGRCFEGGGSPFAPFVEILRRMLLDQGFSEQQAPADKIADRDAAADPDLTQEIGAGSSDLAATAMHRGALPAAAPAAPLRDVILDYRPELLRIAPQLSALLPGEAFRQTDLSREANYILRAITAFFTEAAARQPLCLCLEDLHWADQGTIDLLRHLATGVYRSRELHVESGAPFPRIVICCSTRPGYETVDALLETLTRQGHGVVLPLEPLSLEEARELLALRLDCAPEEVSSALVERIHSACHGNPFYITETIREWRASETVQFGATGWTLAEGSASGGALPVSMRDSLRQRLADLPSDSQRMAFAAAVIGAEIDADLLAGCLNELNENQFLDAVDELLSRRILRETAQAGRLEFVHDLLREATLADLPVDDALHLHRRTGELLEVRRGNGAAAAAGDLARHFLAAHIDDKAFAYLLEAGEDAVNAYALRDAIEHLQQAAERIPDAADSVTRYRLWGALATASAGAFQPEQALVSFEKAIAFAPDAVERARQWNGLAEVRQRQGNWGEALECLDQALAAAGGKKRPRSIVGLLASIAVLNCGIHLLPSKAIRLRDPAARERAEVCLQAQVLTTAVAAQFSLLLYTQSSARQAFLARQLGDPRSYAFGMGKYALNCSFFSLHFVALRIADRVLKLSADDQASEEAALGIGMVGVVLYISGRLRRAESCLEKAVATLDRMGDSWHRQFFHHSFRHIYAVTGENARELRAAELELQIAQAVKDPESMCWGGYGMANVLARTGDLEAAHRYIEMAREVITGRGSIIAEPIALNTHGFVCLQSSDYSQSQIVLREARRMVERNGTFIEYTVRTYPLLVEALLEASWHDPARKPTSPQREAWRLSRLALFFGWRFPNYWPHALRVRGRAAFALGKRKKAEKCFLTSIQAAESLGAQYDLARALLDYAKAFPDQGAEHRHRGLKLLQEQGSVIPEAERD